MDAAAGNRTSDEVLNGRAGAVYAGYSQEYRPLVAYSLLSSTFGAGLVTSLGALHRSGRLPERFGAGDLVLMGVATHKVSRLIAKDKVTSFLRAPFTRYQEASGQGEVEEEARGRGLQLALGELLSCPYCLAQWVAAAFACGLVASPRVTRFVAAIYAAETISDFLQAAYLAAEKRA
jgi:hypothetical protein